MEVKVTYEQLRALPVSNSDALTDAEQQINGVSHTGATTTTNTASSDIDSCVAAYNSQGADTFKQRMEMSRAAANATVALNRAYDEADALVAGADIMEAMKLAIMMEQVNSGFSDVTNPLVNYMNGPALQLAEGGIAAAMEKEIVFENLAALIHANFG